MQNIIQEFVAIAHHYAKHNTKPIVYSKMDEVQISHHQRIKAMGYAFSRAKINALQGNQAVAQLWENAFWLIHGTEK